jgi:predicted kinase
MIVIVFGLPGAGKSYFASRLAGDINARYLNSDQVRNKMFLHRTYSESEKLSVYDEMIQQMKKAIEQNESLVIDATFYKNNFRDMFIKESRNFPNLFFIEVVADESVIKERLKQKRVDSEAGYDVYQTVKAQFEPIQQPHLTLHSTNDNLNDMLKKASVYLKVNDDRKT